MTKDSQFDWMGEAIYEPRPLAYAPARPTRTWLAMSALLAIVIGGTLALVMPW